MTAAQNTPANTKPWRYSTPTERIKETAAAAGGLALYGLALTQIFNPLVAGGLFGYGAAKVAMMYYSMTRPNAAERLMKAGYIKPLPEKHKHLQNIVDDAVAVADMKPHTAYLATDKLLRAQVPWYLRWMLKDEKKRKETMEKIAAALSTSDIAMFSEEFIDKHGPAEERFVALHEMGHCATEDSYSLQSVAKAFKKSVGSPIFYGMGGLFAVGTLAFIGLPVSVASVPVLASGVGLWKATGLLALASGASGLALNYASRVAEYRADRNAVYLGRSTEGGINFLRDTNTKMPAFVDRLPDTSTHPSFNNRVANLHAAWELARQYPAPITATPEAELTESRRLLAEARKRPKEIVVTLG